MPHANMNYQINIFIICLINNLKERACRGFAGKIVLDKSNAN